MADRRTLRQKLWGFANDPNDPLAMALLDTIKKDISDSKGFRSSAPVTISRQDRHLEELMTTARVYWRLERDEMTDEEVRSKIFDQDEAGFTEIATVYLSLSMHMIKPRSNKDKRPRFETLLQRRQSIIFWANRELKIPNWNRNKLINRMNEVLQLAGRRYGTNRSPIEKPFLGRLELAQLLEKETWTAASLPVAENHYLAWTLGCVCGVRPGTMAQSSLREGHYLMWKDIKITRGASRGMFNARIEFRFLKGDRDALTIAKTIVFFVNSPTMTEHISMSPVHRLLIIALRRGLLQSHDSLESLLNSDNFHILLKQSCQHDPVLLAGGIRGLTLADPPKALTARKLTDYMVERAMRAGYGRNVTPYAWRRKAATEMRRQLGLDKARELLGHAPQSTTMQEHYDQGPVDFPVFEVAMRANIQEATATMDEFSSIALTRLIDQTRVQGIFLEQAVLRQEAESPELQEAQDAMDLNRVKAIKRRIRRDTRSALFDEAKRLEDASLTTAEITHRKNELNKPGVFMNKIMATAKANAKLAESQQNVGVGVNIATTSTVPNTSDASAIDAEADLQFCDVRDADDDNPAIGGEVQVNVDIDGQDDEQQEDSLEFGEAVRIYMECMGQDSFVIRENDDLHCNLCIEDPTMSDEAKEKIWDKQYHLSRHQMSEQHCKKQAFIRMVSQAAKQRIDGRFLCPYSDVCPTYTNQRSLIDHIERSTSTNSSIAHDEAKSAAGWYDDDFAYDIVKSQPGAAKDWSTRKGIIYSTEKEMPAARKIALQSTTTAVYEGAGGVSEDIPTMYKGIVLSGPSAMSSGPIPPQYEGVVFSGATHGVGMTLHGHPLAPEYEGIVFTGQELARANARAEEERKRNRRSG